MASRKKAQKAQTKAAEAVEVAKPYVQRLVEDEELRDNLREAYESARDAYESRRRQERDEGARGQEAAGAI